MDDVQRKIIAALGVSTEFDATDEARRHVDFPKRYLQSSGLRCHMIGISGGVDSLTAGILAQRADSEAARH